MKCRSKWAKAAKWQCRTTACRLASMTPSRSVCCTGDTGTLLHRWLKFLTCDAVDPARKTWPTTTTWIFCTTRMRMCVICACFRNYCTMRHTFFMRSSASGSTKLWRSLPLATLCTARLSSPCTRTTLSLTSSSSTAQQVASITICFATLVTFRRRYPG
jgi:hypothetical protein